MKKKTDRAQTAYERLRELIIRGRLAPGARLIELEVARRLDISRTPAREALQRLHQDGFLLSLEVGRRTQFAVTPMTEEDLVDVYTIMAALEGSAARGVSQLDQASRAQLYRTLKEANSCFVAAAKKRNRNFDEMFELHNSFHAALVESVASPRLRRLIDRVRPQVDRYEYVYAAMVGPDYDDTFREHAAIIRAIRAGTSASVEAAVKANWLKSAERLRASYKVMGPRGDW